jgi:hypothetical protein
MKKFCPDCQTEKPLSEFSSDKAKKDKHSAYCKPCSRARAKEWHNKPENKDRMAIKRKEWKDAHPDFMKEYLSTYVQPVTTRYSQYRTGALRRGYTFDITIEMFTSKTASISNPNSRTRIS